MTHNNKKLIRYGVAEWCLPTQSPQALCDAANHHLETIQIDIKTPDHDYFLGNPAIIKEYQQISNKCNIAITGIAINLANQYNCNSGLRFLQEMTKLAIGAAKQLRATLVFLPSFHNNEIKNRQDIENTAHFYRWACDLAADDGIYLASENSLNVANNMLLTQSVNRKNFRIIFDSFNPIIYGSDPLKLLTKLWQHLAPQLHLKDNNNNISNSALVRKILTQLKHLGFHGEIILENKYLEQDSSLDDDIKYIKNFI